MFDSLNQTQTSTNLSFLNFVIILEDFGLKKMVSKLNFRSLFGMFRSLFLPFLFFLPLFPFLIIFMSFLFLVFLLVRIQGGGICERRLLRHSSLFIFTFLMFIFVLLRWRRTQIFVLIRKRTRMQTKGS